jgi:P-type Ca2+ transporter type 2C
MTDAVRFEAWRSDARDVVAELGTDLRQGLTSTEAALRLERFGPNELTADAPVPRWRKFLGQLADPLVYLLLAGVVVSFAAWIIEGHHGVPFEVIVILSIVVINAVLGYVQEARAEQAVAALQRMAAGTAAVLRDGREDRVPSVDVVPGDVLVLAEGDAISADGRLSEVASLMVAEASLTGESDAVLKDTARIVDPVGFADRTNMVFSGTAVTSGRARAIVTATGMATEMGTIARLLGEADDERTPLQAEVNRIGRQLGIAILVIATVVVGAMLFTTDIRKASTVVDVLLIGVSLAIAAVPEGLPAILSVVLARGVQRMARRHAIVKKLSSVETLGSASIVCSDKTGTLTKNEMTIETIVTGSGEVDVSGTGYAPVGGLLLNGAPLADAVLLDEVSMVLGGGSLANNASLREESGVWSIQGDPTDAAFLVAEAKAGLTATRESRFARVGEIPFTSERKLMTSLEADAERDGRVAVVTKGAPDFDGRAAGRGARRGEPSCRPGAADACRGLPSATRRGAARCGRGGRTRTHLPRDGGDNRSSAAGSQSCDHRGPCSRGACHDDHGRSSAHRRSYRDRSRYRGRRGERSFRRRDRCARR